jgi:hypothetical protein
LHICFHIDFPATLSVETIEELEKRLWSADRRFLRWR